MSVIIDIFFGVCYNYFNYYGNGQVKKKMMQVKGSIEKVISCNVKKAVSIDALNILVAGGIKELCVCSYRNEKKHHNFVYDISNLTPFSSLGSMFNFEGATDLLSDAVQAVISLEQKGMTLEGLQYSKDSIYKGANGYKFIYLPLERKKFVSKKTFFLKLLSALRIKDSRSIELIKKLKKATDDSRVIEYIHELISANRNKTNDAEEETDISYETELQEKSSDDTVYDPEAEYETVAKTSFETELGDKSSDDTVYDPKAEYETVANTAYETELGEPVNSEDPNATVVLKKRSLNFGKETVSGLEGRDILYLIRNSSGERIDIDVTPFTIGKDEIKTDYAVPNPAVSRHHAFITYEDGRYFLTDNKSTNGTELNGKNLKPGVRVEIGNDSVISFADEVFRAYIERGRGK